MTITEMIEQAKKELNKRYCTKAVWNRVLELSYEDLQRRQGE